MPAARPWKCLKVKTPRINISIPHPPSNLRFRQEFLTAIQKFFTSRLLLLHQENPDYN